MELIIICILSALVCTLGLALWLNRDAKGKKEDTSLPATVESIQKQMDTTLFRLSRIEEGLKHVLESTGKPEEKEAVKIPLNLESVRIALRYNGFSPEIIDTHLDEWQTVRFKVEDTMFRIDTSRLPFLTLELGYRMNNAEEDLELMERAAMDVTRGIYVAKVFILRGEEECAVLIQAEFIADTYLYLRDNFKRLLDIVIDAQKRFYETYNNLKDEKKKEQEQIQKVLSSSVPSQESKKIVS